jgi:hypothetical protein
MHEHLITAWRFAVSSLAKGQEGLSLHIASHSRDHLNAEIERVAMVPLLKDASAMIVAQSSARLQRSHTVCRPNYVPSRKQ